MYNKIRSTYEKLAVDTFSASFFKHDFCEKYCVPRLCIKIGGKRKKGGYGSGAFSLYKKKGGGGSGVLSITLPKKEGNERGQNVFRQREKLRKCEAKK